MRCASAAFTNHPYHYCLESGRTDEPGTGYFVVCRLNYRLRSASGSLFMF